MARQVRIEFPGAFYHVMARGNRLEPIFISPAGQDQELFLKTLGEACERTGFRVWAWVLMGNHYHLVLETPKANLVAGMGWLQNTYTRRFNARHKKWGRLFGDRYKSILIEEDRSGDGSSYLATLMDYVHLNPARAQLVLSGKKNAGSLLDYPWSSVARGYALAPKKRPKWLCVDAGLELFGWKDVAANRRRFVARLDGRMAAEKAQQCGLAEIDGQTLNSSLRRGWYWGSDVFKEMMLLRLDALAADRHKHGSQLPTGHSYTSGEQHKDHNVQQAEAIIEDAVTHFGLSGGDAEIFAKLPHGDLSAVAVAWTICGCTTLPQSWIAKRLALGSSGNVSERVRRFKLTAADSLTVPVRRWKKKSSVQKWE